MTRSAQGEVTEPPSLAEDEVSSDEEAERCRICYESGGALIAACACRGSMELIHKKCLRKWLASSPLRLRGCDVCGTPWRDEFVAKPSVKRFVSDMCCGRRGVAAFRRFLDHVSTVPRFSEEEQTDIFGEPRRRRPAPRNDDDENNENLDDDEDDDDDDGRRGLDDDEEEEDVVDIDRHPGEDGDDGWDAIGLLAPAGGGVEELNAAAAAIVRLAIWSCLFFLAVFQGRASLRLFAYGVRAVLVLDSRVDALLLPGSVAEYLESLLPGLPCLRRAARFLDTHRTHHHAASAAEVVVEQRQKRTFLDRVGRFVFGGERRRRTIGDGFLNGGGGGPLARFFVVAGRRRQGPPAAPASTLAFTTTTTTAFTAEPTTLWRFLLRQTTTRCHFFGAVPVALAALCRGPWRVDDVFVGFVALALDVRGLARVARRYRRGDRGGLLASPPAGSSIVRHVAVTVARVALSPEAVAHDVATLFEHLVSSPLLVIHWLCVFPSYVYALRLVLHHLNFLSGDILDLDLENGDGVAFHLLLLAVAASATTCFAALAHALHREYVRWAADVALNNLR